MIHNSMKSRILTWLAAAVVVGIFASGCVVAKAPLAHTTITTTDPDGVVTVEERDARGASLIAWGDAKQSLDKLRVSNGKTLSIGVSGQEQETSAANVAPIVNSFGGLFGEAMRTFVGLPPAPGAIQAHQVKAASE